MQPGGKPQVFVHCQFPVEWRNFRQITDVRLGFPRLVQQIDAANSDNAGAGRKVTGQHAHDGCFARAIGTKEAQYFAPLQFEVDVAPAAWLPK